MNKDPNSKKTKPKPPLEPPKTVVKNKVEPFVCAVFGRPNSGKTYNIEQNAKNYKGTVFVYNFGREEDFADYTIIEIVENPNKKDKNLLFRIKGQTGIYELEKDFMRLFKGQRVKCALAPKKEQEKLFLAIASSENLQHILFIIDDCTVVATGRLSDGLKMLLAKSKHNKVDVILIAHAMNVFPPSAFPFLTHIKMFKTLKPPTAERLKLVPDDTAVIQAWHKLNELPDYSFIYMDVLRGINSITLPKT